MTAEPLILASASAARAALLRAAGIEFSIEPAALDEDRIKRAARQAGESARDCALTLAGEKARQVSGRFPEALVVGADQILALGADWFDKPADIQKARLQLQTLRGRMHTLETAVCVAQGGSLLWHATCGPELHMRQFSDAFLDRYIASEGAVLLGSVGAYHLEGRGVQLFSRIVGDYFSVLGLPLVDLLGFLRDRGALPV